MVIWNVTLYSYYIHGEGLASMYWIAGVGLSLTGFVVLSAGVACTSASAAFIGIGTAAVGLGILRFMPARRK